MLASISALMSASSRLRAASAWPGSHRPGAGVEVLLGQAPVLRQRRGVHDRADLAEAVADPPVGGQERPLAADGAGDAEQPAGRPGQLQNSSPVASVRNSGRSSRARHSRAVSTARTGSGRGRPVAWASAASMTGALPERSMSSAANATVCVADAAGAAAGPGRCRSSRALRAAAGPQDALGGADAGHVAGVPGQRPGLGDPGDGQQHADRGARGQVAADEGGPGPAHRQGGRGRVSGQAPGEIGDEVLIGPVGRAGAEHDARCPRGGPAPRPGRHSAR